MSDNDLSNDLNNCSYFGRQLLANQGMQKVVQRVPGGYLVEGLTGQDIMLNSSADIQKNIKTVNYSLVHIIYTALVNNTASCQNTSIITPPFSCNALTPCPEEVIVFNSSCTTDSSAINNDITSQITSVLGQSSQKLPTALNALIGGLANNPSSNPTVFNQFTSAISGFVNDNIQTIMTNIIAAQNEVIGNASTTTTTNGITTMAAKQLILTQLLQYPAYVTFITNLTMTQQAQAQTQSSSSWLRILLWIFVAIIVILIIYVIVRYVRHRMAKPAPVT